MTVSQTGRRLLADLAIDIDIEIHVVDVRTCRSCYKDDPRLRIRPIRPNWDKAHTTENGGFMEHEHIKREVGDSDVLWAEMEMEME